MLMLCAVDSHDFVLFGNTVLCRKCGAVLEGPTSDRGPLIIPAIVQAPVREASTVA